MALPSALGALAVVATCHAQITAGIDFDSGGPVTEAGFLSVPATSSKDYNVTHNGITFDIDGTSTKSNQNRLRSSGEDVNNDLTRDFIQWWSSDDGTVIPDIGTYVPGYAGQGYQFKGFGWHQGWNDRVDQSAVDEYEENLVDFINDVRFDLNVPGLPFVVANTGIGGASETNTRALALMQAQLNVANATLYPDFAGNVASIDTRPFWRDASISPITSGNQGFHWNQNGETMFLIGDAMGDEMVGLLSPP